MIKESCVVLYTPATQYYVCFSRQLSRLQELVEWYSSIILVYLCKLAGKLYCEVVGFTLESQLVKGVMPQWSLQAMSLLQ